MDSKPTKSSRSCSCSQSPRTLKRKLNQINNNLTLDLARIDTNIEAAALREAIASHQKTIHKLYSELEAERAAASTAASEAMSMILRLQREKAEAQMEARQFKLLAEEKMRHDQQQIDFLEDLVFKRDETLKLLKCKVEALVASGELSSFVEKGVCAVDEGEIRRLYVRLQALEADGECMRDVVESMGTEKAERVLLEEIARRLERRVVKRPGFGRGVMAVFKVICDLDAFRLLF